MAEKWRNLSAQEKEVYKSKVQEVNEVPLQALSAKERRNIMIRIARRHQEDVSVTIFPSTYPHKMLHIQANTAEQLGFEVANMYCLDGEVVTVGTRKGKAYLNSHPAILSTFQSKFLYGKPS